MTIEDDMVKGEGMTDSVPSWLDHLAEELTIARKRAGYASQREFGDAVGWSRSRIADFESGAKLPPREFIDATESILASDGVIQRVWNYARRGDISQWILDLIDAEQRATQIRTFEPATIPGLLQTREAAHAILSAGRYASSRPGQESEILETRMQRQDILSGDALEMYWVIIDEAVLNRTIGSPDVMRDQLKYLLDVMTRLPVRIQVLPHAAGAYVAAGPMVILDVDRNHLVHVDGPVSGTTTADSRIIRECTEIFDVLRSQAASLPESARMIEARMEEL